MEWSTERLWSAISHYFLGFSEVVVFRVDQNSESNDLYPLSVPVLYELYVCFQQQYKCGCRLACEVDAAGSELCPLAGFGISGVEPSGFGTRGLVKWKVKSEGNRL
jgi:hypothetical protein